MTEKDLKIGKTYIASRDKTMISRDKIVIVIFMGFYEFGVFNDKKIPILKPVRNCEYAHKYDGFDQLHDSQLKKGYFSHSLKYFLETFEEEKLTNISKLSNN